MPILSVEKRAADALKVLGHRLRSAGALSCGVAEIAATAGVHGADQHK